MHVSASRCFVSYARVDLPRVEPLVLLLKAAGVPTFRDLDDLEFGRDWRSQLCAAIDDAAQVLVLWTEAASRSDGVAQELAQALARPGCVVVPIMLDDTPMPPDLAARHGVDLRPALSGRGSGTGSAGRNEAVNQLKKVIFDGDFSRVESELMDVRRRLRAFNAIANSKNTPWFGRSDELQSLTYFAVIREILMAIWRLSSPTGANGVPHALLEAGRDARVVAQDPDILHLRRYIENKIIECADYRLVGLPELVPGVPADTIQLASCSRAVNVLSTAYAKCREVEVEFLDPTPQLRDPFIEAFRDSGLPVIDFSPAAIFKR